MLDKTMLKKLADSAEKLKGPCLGLSHYLSDHPEISGEEENSCAYICDFLSKRGYAITTPYVGVKHSFKAERADHRDADKPKVAVMCEYDALKEIGHGCGHSLSCAVSLLAAFVIEDVFGDSFPFQIDLIGTPAEELGGGKILLADAGAFDGYDMAIMAHASGALSLPVMKARASCDMQVTFHGRSAHASMEPWNGINALNATQLFFHALDMMRQHLTPDCQMHGIITKGGDMPSIVPDKCVSYFYPRAGSLKMLNQLWDKMVLCAKGAAMATGTTVDIEMLYNKYAELFFGKTDENFVLELFDNLEIPYMYDKESYSGSTDAGNVDVLIPTFHPMFGVGDDPNITMHSQEFAKLIRGEAAGPALINGSRIVTGIIATLALDQELFEKVKKEHREYRNC